jgi:peptide/nickel transport system permease protein
MIGVMLHRTLVAMVTLWLALTLAFVMVRGAGDPVRMMLGPDATEARVNEVREDLGLTRPILVQYVSFLSDIARGNLGQSFSHGVANAGLIGRSLLASMQLAVGAMGCAVVVGVLLGVGAALRIGSWLDRFAMWFAAVAQSIPQFWIGMLLVMVFAERLQWLPAGARGGPDHMILPIVTLSLSPLAKVAMLTRSGMVQVMGEEFIAAARARGIAPWRVIAIHGLRNAILPVVTIIALQAGSLMSSAVSVELVFSWPGLGHLATSAVLARDFPLVQSIVLVSSAIFVGVNLLADLVYMLVDPRIRNQAQ